MSTGVGDDESHGKKKKKKKEKKEKFDVSKEAKSLEFEGMPNATNVKDWQLRFLKEDCGSLRAPRCLLQMVRRDFDCRQIGRLAHG